MRQVGILTKPPKPKPFKARPKPEFWQAVHRAAARQVPAFRRAFLKTIRAAARSVPTADLVGLLERNRPELAVDLFNRDRIEAAYGKELLPLIHTMMSRAARLALPSVMEFGKAAGGPAVGDLGIGGVLGMSSPEAIRAAALFAASEVTLITESTRAALREIVRNAQASGVTIPDQARAIARELKQSVGLTAPQIKSLERLTEGWTEAGLSQGRINTLRAETRLRMIGQRSIAIAHNETMEAANLGVEELWEEAIKDDLLPTTVIREWLTQPGLNSENPCEICRPMDGQRRPMGVAFTSPFNGATALRPGIHIRCMCIVVIARDQISPIVY